ncbi:MAG: hypothetical protein GXZ09_00665 [Syntrophomonadaceae bacterium]|mgnify:FL=1|jgi:hypothetical protein|nr:hypothetical protein [Syntrophomonadaceae bacterium]
MKQVVITGSTRGLGLRRHGLFGGRLQCDQFKSLPLAMAHSHLRNSEKRELFN